MRWTEAGQVTRVLGWPDRVGAPDPKAPPSAYFAALRAAGRNADAADFLGQALPRWEAVAWAARSVRDLGASDEGVDPADSRALRAALLWVQDPTEARRRQAETAARAANPVSAAAMAALAAFYSGGSVAPADCEPLPAPRDAAGRCAAGAVQVAAARSADGAAALSYCLDAGAALAAAMDGGAA